MFLQKLVYQMLLTGFPSLTYNPITKNPFHANFKVDTNSLYINYVLNEDARSKIESYIDDDIELEQISLEKGKSKNFFLSINIYNVTSPILNTINTVTRCEINTYVKRKSDGKKGTIILDYSSNSLSMDPVNIFKPRSFSTHYIKNKNRIDITALSKEFQLFGYIDIEDNDKHIFVNHRDLHKYTDNIFYNNGIYDKIYYDSSLTHCKTLKPINNEISFYFDEIQYNKPYSVFYFTTPLCFSGAMWYNIYNED